MKNLLCDNPRKVILMGTLTESTRFLFQLRSVALTVYTVHQFLQLVAQIQRSFSFQLQSSTQE